MHRLPIAAFFVALWLALGTDPLGAQGAQYCDHGRAPHAQGEVRGYRYVVEHGYDKDTLFSISRRFCTSEEAIAILNNISDPRVIPYTVKELKIPGLGPEQPAGCMSPFLSIAASQPDPRTPTLVSITGSGCGLSDDRVAIFAQSGFSTWYRVDTVPLTAAYGGSVTYSTQLNFVNARGQLVTLYAEAGGTRSDTISVNIPNALPTCTASSVNIDSLPNLSSVLAPFDVTGTAGPNCTVMVRARHSRWGPLGEEKSANTGAGMSWRTTMAVTLPAGNLSGDYVTIEAYIPQTSMSDSIQVTVGSSTSGGDLRDFPQEECKIILRYPALPTFAYPDGPYVNTLPNTGVVTPRRVVRHSGQYWYVITRGYGQLDDWIHGSGVTPITAFCEP